MTIRSGLVAAVWVAVAVVPRLGEAAVYQGTVTAYSADSRELTMDVTRGNASRTFVLTETAVVLEGTKKSSADQLGPGQTVTVTTNSKNEATRVVIRGGSAPARTQARGGGDAGEAGGSLPGEWPQYRGPRRDNKSAETGLLKSWPDGGPQLAMTIEGLGEAYSSVAIVGKRLYTMGNRGNDEFLLAYDLATGDEVWATRSGDAYREGQGNGPRGTPVVDGTRVYALGANGDLICAEADSGKPVWQGNILREFGGDNIVWGISETPLIDGNQLVCTPGGRGGTVVALDKSSGKLVWKAQVPGDPQAAYSSAIAATIGGVRQYVNFVHTGLVGIEAATGRVLWGDRTSANGTANCSSAIAVQDVVFSSTGYGTGGALVRVSGSPRGMQANVVYATKEMQNHHGGMVELDGYLYGSSDPGVLRCLDLKTGNVVWQNRSVGKGSLTYADGHLYVRSEGGPVALVEASPKAYVEKGRFDQPQRSNRPAWSHPVVAGGKLYLRDQDKLLVYDVK